MSDAGKSRCAYGLAALTIVCATVLGALRVVPGSTVVALYGMAVGVVGSYHALAPGQPGPGVPPAGEGT